MSTFRKDLHLGHEVPLVESDDIAAGAITKDKMAENSVGTDALEDGSVTEPKLADDSVSSRTLQEGAVEEPALADDSVGTRSIQDESITEPKLADNSVGSRALQKGSINADNISGAFLDEMVLRLTDRIVETTLDRMVADGFGNSDRMTISQKVLTDTINDIYGRIRDINGEPPVGLYLYATPDYYIGEDGANVHIKAINTSGLFEHVAFFVDGQMIEGAEAKNVYTFEIDTHIGDTAVIKCEATILGIDYSVEKIITHYDSFWLGAGRDYTDIMDAGHTIPVKDEIRGAYDVACNEGDHFIIIVGEKFRAGFIRADLNGFEIPFTIRKITWNGNDYWVYTSENVYYEGVYNIDING